MILVKELSINLMLTNKSIADIFLSESTKINSLSQN